ncbi:unnamed protein product [Ambrosiozyma monospora]|uniref:Unnamed protein product n=1 Tax=Ambrosiozyma monospora TaxID=43982 RepID=A0A9W6WK47_AMBMO|nr:unnamed protein product [Ambrosiozyma monospora]
MGTKTGMGPGYWALGITGPRFKNSESRSPFSHSPIKTGKLDQTKNSPEKWASRIEIRGHRGHQGPGQWPGPGRWGETGDR